MLKEIIKLLKTDGVNGKKQVCDILASDGVNKDNIEAHIDNLLILRNELTLEINRLLTGGKCSDISDDAVGECDEAVKLQDLTLLELFNMFKTSEISTKYGFLYVGEDAYTLDTEVR